MNVGGNVLSPFHHNSANLLLERLAVLEQKIAKRDRIVSNLKDQRNQLTKDYGLLAQENQLLKS